MTQKRESGSWLSEPIGVLRAAIRKVPAMKWALAVAGVASVVAIVTSFGIDKGVAVFGSLVMLGLMVAIFIFAQMTALARWYFHYPAMVMMWSFIILTVLASLLLFTYVFFAWPPNLQRLFNTSNKEVVDDVSLPRDLQQQADAILQTNDRDVKTILGDYRETEQVLEDALISLESGNKDAPNEAAKLATAISRISILYDPQRSLIFANRAIKHDPQYYPAWNQRGRALSRIGMRKEAIKAHRKAIDLCTDQRNELCIADQYRNLGLLYARAGANREALTEHRKALSVYEDLSNAEGIAAEHINIGIVLHNLGDLDQAVQENESGLEMAKAIKKGDLIFLAENALGNISMVRRRYDEAETHFLLALGEATQLQNHSDIMSALGNLSDCYSRQGRDEDALSMLDRAIGIGEKIGDKAAITGNLNDKALIYFKQGKLAQARELHQRSLDMARENNLRVEEAAALSNLGRIARREGQPKEALNYFSQAFTIYKELGSKQGLAKEAANVATAQHLLCNYKEAEKFYRIAIRLYPELKIPELEGNNYSNLGELLLTLGRRQEAIDAFGRASNLFLQAGLLKKKEEVDSYIEKAKRGESLAKYCADAL